MKDVIVVQGVAQTTPQTLATPDGLLASFRLVTGGYEGDETAPYGTGPNEYVVIGFRELAEATRAIEIDDQLVVIGRLEVGRYDHPNGTLQAVRIIAESIAHTITDPVADPVPRT